MRHRLARIVPLYWVTTTIWLLLGQTFDLRSLVGSYLFIPFMLGDSVHPLYGVGWTLNFEMFFYAVFAPCLFLLKPRALTVLAGVLGSVVVLGRLMAPQAALIIWTDPLILEFLAGALIAVLYRSGVMLPNPLRLAMIVAAIVVICHYRMPEIGGHRWIRWGIPAAFIVAAAVLGSQRWVDGTLGDIARTLGDASYSLYLLHMLVLSGALALMHRLEPVYAPLVLMLGWLSAVALSLVTYRYFERPITNFLKRPARPATMPAAAQI
jgi:peptidoglycan/LPS O-acetylase OafA/YrhL